MAIKQNIESILATLSLGVSLVAVSKTFSVSDIEEAYNASCRAFGENRPQELLKKQQLLPKDIEWHYIGSLQTNKVKYIAPFVKLIHSVDSDRLLGVINSEAAKNDRVIDILFEVHVAKEDTKHGWEPENLYVYLSEGGHNKYPNICVRGLMTMATYTSDMDMVREEFLRAKELFDRLKGDVFVDRPSFDTLSMGMSGDYILAQECGSTMVRVGSSIFGNR